MTFKYKVGDRFERVYDGTVFVISNIHIIMGYELMEERGPLVIRRDEGELDFWFTKLNIDTREHDTDALRYMTTISGEWKADCNSCDHEPHEVILFTSTVTECKKCGTALAKETG